MKLSIELSDISRYEIIWKIKFGRTANVFLAKDTKENKKVVLKIYKPIKKSIFTKEYKNLKILQSEKNIITILGIINIPYKN